MSVHGRALSGWTEELFYSAVTLSLTGFLPVPAGDQRVKGEAAY